MDSPLARTPDNVGHKSCFSASYSPSQRRIPNLKLLASTVAEINRWSQIFTCSLAQTPINLALNVVFGKLIPVPKLCKKILAQCASMMTETVCFEQKTTTCNEKFGDLGNNGDRGSNMSSKVPYLESPTLICLFTMQLSGLHKRR